MFRRCWMLRELEPPVPWVPVLPFQPTFFSERQMTTPKTQERWENLPELKLSAEQLAKMNHGDRPATQRWLRFKQQELADTSNKKYAKARNIGHKTQLIAQQYEKLFKKPEREAASLLKKQLKPTHELHQKSLQVRRLIAEKQQEKLMLTAERSPEYAEWKKEWEEEWKRELEIREKHKTILPAPTAAQSLTDGKKSKIAAQVASAVSEEEEEANMQEEVEEGNETGGTPGKIAVGEEEQEELQGEGEGEGDGATTEEEEDYDSMIDEPIMIRDSEEEEEDAENLSVYDETPRREKKRRNKPADSANVEDESAAPAKRRGRPKKVAAEIVQGTVEL